MHAVQQVHLTCNNIFFVGTGTIGSGSWCWTGVGRAGVGRALQRHRRRGRPVDVWWTEESSSSHLNWWDDLLCFRGLGLEARVGCVDHMYDLTAIAIVLLPITDDATNFLSRLLHLSQCNSVVVGISVAQCKCVVINFMAFNSAHVLPQERHLHRYARRGCKGHER